MDGKEGKAEEPEGERKGRGCAVDPSSSIPSQAPIKALLFAVGLIAFRRLRVASRCAGPYAPRGAPT